MGLSGERRQPRGTSGPGSDDGNIWKHGHALAWAEPAARTAHELGESTTAWGHGWDTRGRRKHKGPSGPYCLSESWAPWTDIFGDGYGLKICFTVSAARWRKRSPSEYCKPSCIWAESCTQINSQQTPKGVRGRCWGNDRNQYPAILKTLKQRLFTESVCFLINWVYAPVGDVKIDEISKVTWCRFLQLFSIHFYTHI